MRSNNSPCSSNSISSCNDYFSLIDLALSCDEGFQKTCDKHSQAVELVCQELNACNLDKKQINLIRALTDWDYVLSNNAIIAFLKFLHQNPVFQKMLDQGSEGMPIECKRFLDQLLVSPIFNDFLEK